MLKCDSDESIGIVLGALEDASALGMIFLSYIIYALCPHKEVATDFFAVTCTNIGGFLSFFRAQHRKRMPEYLV